MRFRGCLTLVISSPAMSRAVRGELQFSSHNIIDAFIRRFEHSACAPAVHFLPTGDVEGACESWTFGELHHYAMGIGRELQGRGLAGQRALLIYPPGVDFIAALIGCFYAGVIAVPVYPPTPSDFSLTVQRLVRIARDCDARSIISLPQLAHMAVAAPAFSGLNWHTFIRQDTSASRLDIAFDQEIAFLQYTSGSTGDPKGVIVGHDNLWFNILACERRYPSRHMVSWLPAYHDMGLIGGILTTLAMGGELTLLPPHAFLQRPSRWMRAVSHARADRTVGPNFGYSLVARKLLPRDVAGLDLSCLRHAIVGAEPVSPRMIREFCQKFAGVGFRPEVFAPAFGLAEGTLLVSSRAAPHQPVVARFDADALTRGEAVTVDAGGSELVGCGTSIDGQQIVIADPETSNTCEDGQVGEILVRGPSVCRGYWGRPESVDEVFACEVSGQTGKFLRTGDLGFLRDDVLFIVGRIKDLIIIRGKNFAATDIEATVEQVCPTSIRPGRVVAAPLNVTGEEKLLVLVELRNVGLQQGGDDLVTTIARAVTTDHGIHAHTIVLLRTGGLPRTSSGKLRRTAARDQFVAGDLREATICSRSHADLSYYRPSTDRVRLDRRPTRYRFDLERDIPWDQLDRPGIYLPDEILAQLGLDTSRYRSDPEAYDVLQWAVALSTCRTFEVLEWGIIEFCRDQQPALGASASIDNLRSEEEKHIRLFRRFASHLEGQRPELVAAFNVAFADSFKFLRGLFDRHAGPRYHLQTWLDALLFEPYSLYLAHTLMTTDQPVQPVWLQVHALHAREESHHVVTVGHFVDHLQLDGRERDDAAQAFVSQLEGGFEHIMGVAAPMRLLAQRYPEYGSDVKPRMGALPKAFVDTLAHAKEFLPLRRALPHLARRTSPPRPDVVFVLSSERSGSTLLRVMLSAHGELFSPPELNLLSFQSLEERERELPEVQRDGLIQAWMALYGETRTAALARLDQYADAPIGEVYRDLTEALGDKILIDKSPMYSRDAAALRRAEAMFGERVRYIYLTRHPVSVIDSYARIGLQRLTSDDIHERRDPYELGEMGWTLSNQTVQAFLDNVDPRRVWSLRYEDLVVEPRVEMLGLLEFLGVTFDPAVLDPYGSGKMVEQTGYEALVGDLNFAAHKRIDALLADAWRRVRLPRSLGKAAVEVAESLGYELEGQAVVAVDHSSATPGVERRPHTRAQVRAIVIDLLARTADIDRVSLTDDTALSDLGIGSLQRIRLTDVLEQMLTRPLDAMTLYNYPTVGALVDFLSGSDTPPAPPKDPQNSFGAAFDLESEVHLPDVVLPAGPVRTGTRVLLTGATGFLGAYLLRDLLADHQTTVHCLVRAKSPAAAERRVRENLERYGLWHQVDPRRICCEAGDVGRPAFGLPPLRYRQLVQVVTSVVHNAALLRFDQPYAPLKPANVEGTQHIIAFASDSRLKRVHHVSTIAVLDATPHRGGKVYEHTPLTHYDGICLGYAQSKWVAERIVAFAGERGLPVTVYRPGGIAGDSQTGAWNTEDLICRILKGCIIMGSAPRLDFCVDMAPVDYVSRSLVTLARCRDSIGQIYHFNHPKPMPWMRLCGWLQFRGYAMEFLDYDDWLVRLRDVSRDPGHPLAPLYPFLTHTLADGQTLFQARQQRPIVDCGRTLAAVGELGITCPPLGHELFSTWFDAMCRSGFLQEPVVGM